MKNQKSPRGNHPNGLFSFMFSVGTTPLQFLHGRILGIFGIKVQNRLPFPRSRRQHFPVFPGWEERRSTWYQKNGESSRIVTRLVSVLFPALLPAKKPVWKRRRKQCLFHFQHTRRGLGFSQRYNSPADKIQRESISFLLWHSRLLCVVQIGR